MINYRRKFLIGLSLIAMMVSSHVGLAQNRNVKTDPAFTAFWVNFKDAIAKNDKQRVADLTKLPFLMRGIDHDRAGFIKEYPTLFTLKMRRCIARAKPIKTQDYLKTEEYYEIFCGDQIFLFGKVDGVWKFVEIGVND